MKTNDSFVERSRDCSNDECLAFEQRLNEWIDHSISASESDDQTKTSPIKDQFTDDHLNQCQCCRDKFALWQRLNVVLRASSVQTIDASSTDWKKLSLAVATCFALIAFGWWTTNQTNERDFVVLASARPKSSDPPATTSPNASAAFRSETSPSTVSTFHQSSAVEPRHLGSWQPWQSMSPKTIHDWPIHDWIDQSVPTVTQLRASVEPLGRTLRTVAQLLGGQSLHHTESHSDSPLDSDALHPTQPLPSIHPLPSVQHRPFSIGA